MIYIKRLLAQQLGLSRNWKFEKSGGFHKTGIRRDGWERARNCTTIPAISPGEIMSSWGDYPGSLLRYVFLKKSFQTLFFVCKIKRQAKG